MNILNATKKEVILTVGYSDSPIPSETIKLESKEEVTTANDYDRCVINER